MKIILNKKRIDDWDAVVTYLSRVCDDVELIEVEGLQYGSILHRMQFWAERHFSAPLTDSLTPFESHIKQKTSNIVLNLSSVPSKKIAAKYQECDIWSIEYLGRSIASYDGQGIGIKEICHDKDTINVALVKYGRGDDASSVVDVAYYNPHYSAYRNYQKALVSMPRLFVRSIISLQIESSSIAGNSVPASSVEWSKYCCRFYNKVFRKYQDVLNNKLFGGYEERWTVAVGEGAFLKNRINNIKVHPMPQNEFWADPFIFEKGEKKYLFFERFPYDKKKGIISVAEIDGEQIKNDRDIIEQPYHLSYPNVFEEDGDIYMIPECSANNRIEIYRCINFPYQWELFSKGFEGASLVDTCYYRDDDGNRWLFTSRSWDGIDTHNEALEIYKIDSLKLNSIIPHKNNPIYVDSRKGRNGGRIFKDNGVTYRASQDNRYGKYGHGVSLNRIEKLTLEDFKEHNEAILLGSEIKGYRGTHQLCQGFSNFVIDLRI